MILFGDRSYFWGSVKNLCFLEKSYDSVCLPSYMFCLAKKFVYRLIEYVVFTYISSYFFMLLKHGQLVYTVYFGLFLESLFSYLGRKVSLFPYSIHSIRRI